MYSDSLEGSVSGKIDFKLCDKWSHSETSYLENEKMAMKSRSVAQQSNESFSIQLCKSNEELKKDLDKMKKERIDLENQANALKEKIAEMDKENSKSSWQAFSRQTKVSWF